MSEDTVTGYDLLCCASCGIAEVDEIKLKECDDCDLVRYCSDECQKEHKSEHEEACKKRAAELRDELLFKQPESTHLGDCPICMLPLFDVMKSTLNACCSKFICNGCNNANIRRECEEKRVYSCPFCRTPMPKTSKDCDKLMMKRVEMNDPVAMRQQGEYQLQKGDYNKAFEYFAKAAELGDAEAHYQLVFLYRDGEGGFEKDIGKAIYHMEEASIQGHPLARHALGCTVLQNTRNAGIAQIHFIIAATQGHDKSVKCLMELFKIGKVQKNVLASTLRAHQAAVEAMKSPDREAAEQYY